MIPTLQPPNAQKPPELELAALSDEDLLALIARSDRAAFETLFRRHYPRLFRFVQRLTQTSDLTEEIVNDAMLVVWQRATRFECRSRVSTWLMGIAYHITLKRLARRQREGVAVDVESVALVDPNMPNDVIDQRRQELRLREGLAQLPAAQRAVVELTYFHGYGYAEVARLIQCPVGTVKTRMFHARKMLRSFLGTAEPTGAKRPEPHECP